MRKYTFALLSLLLAALCLAAIAQQAAPPAQEPAAKAQACKVVSVNAEKGELAIKNDKNADETLQVNSDTKITKAGKDISLAEIKAGDWVRYEHDADKGAVKAIEVVTAKPNK